MSENTEMLSDLEQPTCEAENNDEYESIDAPDGGVYLTKYKGNDEDVVIPAQWKGRPVVGLRGAFKGKTNIKSITIPDSITSISIESFSGCSELTSVTISESGKN